MLKIDLPINCSYENSIELSLDLELNDNNIYDLDDKSYKEKYELYKKL